MDDYLTEQDQWEAVKRWLKENGPWIVGGIVLGAAVLYGYRWYQDRTTTDARAAAVEYAELANTLSSGDHKRAAELVDRLRTEHPRTPYIDQAELALARVHVERNELDEAAKKLRAVMESSKDKELRQVARVRLARVLIAQNKPDDALKLLDVKEAGAFAPRYNEVRGDALAAKGDKEGALKAYQEALLAMEPGVVDQNQIQLKMSDLAGAQQ